MQSLQVPSHFRQFCVASVAAAAAAADDDDDDDRPTDHTTMLHDYCIHVCILHAQK